jgi:hypothetical protein
MPLTETFQAQLMLLLPSDEGQPMSILEMVSSGTFTKKTDYKLELPSTPGTHTVNFGSVSAPGAKVLYVEYVQTASGQAPVTVGGLEISPGGGIQVVNPAPVSGLISLTIAHTTAATLRVVLLG